MTARDPALDLIAELSERVTRLENWVRNVEDWSAGRIEGPDEAEPDSLPREGNVVYLNGAPDDD